MKRKYFIMMAATAMMLTACAGQGIKEGVAKRGEQRGGLFGMSKSDDVKITTPDAFAGANEVVIGNFAIGFATYKTDSSKAGGGLMGSGFGGKSTAKSTLAGVDDATMQAITDAAYKDFVARLKDGGYKVLDRSVLLNDSGFAKSKTTPSPLEESKGGLFGKGSRTVYFAPGGFDGMKVFMGDIVGEMGGFATANPLMSATTYAQKSGVKVLSVVYVLDFANAETYGGFARSSSSVQVGQGLTVVPETSKLSLIGGQGGTFSKVNGALVIGQPITSEKEFARVTDSTTGAAKGMEVAANVIGVLGGVGTNTSRNYTFDANAADYKTAAVDAAFRANSALVGTMKSLR